MSGELGVGVGVREQHLQSLLDQLVGNPLRNIVSPLERASLAEVVCMSTENLGIGVFGWVLGRFNEADHQGRQIVHVHAVPFRLSHVCQFLDDGLARLLWCFDRFDHGHEALLQGELGHGVHLQASRIVGPTAWTVDAGRANDGRLDARGVIGGEDDLVDVTVDGRVGDTENTADVFQVVVFLQVFALFVLQGRVAPAVQLDVFLRGAILGQ